MTKKKRKKAKNRLQKLIGINAKGPKKKEGFIIDGKGIRYVKRF